MKSITYRGDRRFRTASILLVVFMVSSIALLSWQLYASQQTEYELVIGNAEKRSSQLARAAADRLAATIRSIDFLLQSARSDYVIGTRNFDEMSTRLSKTYKETDFLRLVVANEKGDVIYPVTPGVKPVSFAERDFFKRFLNGDDQLLITQPFQSRISGEWIILFVRPILRGGQFAGVATISLKPDQISGILGTLELERSDSIAVIGTDGTYYARNALMGQLYGRKLAEPRPFIRPDPPLRGNYRAASFSDGRPRLFGWERVPGTDLVLVTGIDEADALAPFERHVRQNWGIAAVFTLFVVALGTSLLALLRFLSRQQASVVLSEARFRQLTGLSSDWYWEQDADFRYTFLSKELERHVGVKAEALIGTTRWGRPSNLSEEEWAAHRAQLERHEPFRDFVYMRKGADGVERWIQSSGDPVFDDRGQFVGYRGVGRHITDQMLSARALEEQRLQMSKVIEAFDHLESGMVLYGPDDRLIFCNKRFRELYSSVADMLVPGAPYADITREFYLRTTHDEAGAEAYLQKRLDQHRHPTGLDSEYFIAPDRWVLISDRRTADGGVIGFRLDITERKHAEAAKAKLEEQLRQSQKLETVGTLAAGIAHDFNNILTAIIGNVQMAIEDIPADHQAQENLGEIRRAGHRARDLVRQILAFSQQHAPERHVVRLADIVEEAVRMLRATLPAGIELAVDVAAPDARIEADRAQIMQVLVNLCTNAWHAIGSKVGRIDIIIETIDVSSATNGDAAGMAPGRYAKLSVRDTGSGMEEAVLQRIFDPFFTTKAPGEGTGLGLAVVHGIVSGHGGTIQVASQPGHGTTFTLYFPTVQQAPISEDAPAGIAPRGQAQHILYLDDDELLVLLIEKLLERLGYRVTAHTDAARALADVENQRDIALVVTDYNMPGKSGLDFAADIRRVRPDMPIVLTSGYVTDDLRTEAAALGIRAVLYKPNTMDELASAIHRILVDEGLADQPD